MQELKTPEEYAELYNASPTVKTMSVIHDEYFAVATRACANGRDINSLTKQDITKILREYKAMTPESIKAENISFIKLLDEINERWYQFVALIDLTIGENSILLGSPDGTFSNSYATTEQALRWLFEFAFQNFIREAQPSVFSMWKPREVVRQIDSKSASAHNQNDGDLVDTFWKRLATKLQLNCNTCS